MVKKIKPLQVLSVASEMYPFIKTGGLADVVGALPFALGELNVSVTTLIPGYLVVLAELTEPVAVLDLPNYFGA
jgi:starch synthase